VEFLEFAEAYSADQLKKSCQQFVCVNAACFLEGRWASSDVIKLLYMYIIYYHIYRIYEGTWTILKIHFLMNYQQLISPW
jgi:hypothetical protein